LTSRMSVSVFTRIWPPWVWHWKKRLRAIFVLLCWTVPNPLRGDIVEGDVLDPPTPARLTGFYPVPVRHGLTAGELVRWWNDLNGWKAKLEVVPLGKWKRNQWYDEAGWTFIPPSPNIRTLTGALLYVGIGCFEATNVSVGRGTDMPFEIFGAPWMDGAAVCAYLRTQKFQGAVFEPVTFVPTEDLYKGETCHGVRIRITNRNTIRPYALFTSAFFHDCEKRKRI
jgi:uncharacterized protein YbbC (DUF1343 family)